MPRGDSHEKRRTEVGLPPRPFLYTVDQIGVMFGLSEQSLRKRYLWYEGRNVGKQDPHKMLAHNIAAPDDKPDWRVSERELVRWMLKNGFRHYENSYFK